jgi:mannan endo-1,4-beta-mannosidase
MNVRLPTFVLSGLLLAASGGGEEQRAMPVNPKATKEARQLLAFLYDVQGKYTLSGQHNFIATGSRFTNLVHEQTGRYPLVWGSDFSFAYRGEAPRDFQHCGPLNLSEPGTETKVTDLRPETARQQMVENAIKAYRDGHVVTLMWHACPPQIGGDVCDGRAIWTLEKRPSQAEWDRLTKEGTELHEAWKKQVDVIAGYLKQLKDAGVPVLWRPYHEMNGVWFWWCDKKGKDGFRKLWIMMYERFVNHHGLDNLIWVWNTNAPRDRPNDEAFAYEEFWPGHEYVDVLAADVYHEDWKQSHHDDLARLARGKPIALGEVGTPPTPETLAAQPRWAWFMPWGNLVLWGKGPERLKALFADDRILTRDEVTRGEDGAYRIAPRKAGPR